MQRRVLSGGFGGSFLFVAQDGFATEADFVAFDGQDLHQDLVAFLQLVADCPDAGFGDFTDVQQAVGAGENLDEGAEIRDAHDRAR